MKSEGKGKKKESSPVPSPPSETTTPIDSPPTGTTDLTPGKTGPTAKKEIEIIRVNICPYIATGTFAEKVAEKFSQQIKGIL